MVKMYKLQDSETFQRARCKGMMQAYLRGPKKGATLKQVLVFLNPPNEPALPRPVFQDIFREVLTEMPNPIPDRVNQLKKNMS